MSELHSCKYCCSEISSAAKICPFCRSSQNNKAPLIQFGVFLAIFIPLLFIVFPLKKCPEYKPRATQVFSNFKDQITIKSSEYSISDCERCKNKYGISTIGIISNNTPYSWESLKIEIRFYNKEGALIDSMSQYDMGSAIMPNGEYSFRVLEEASAPKEAYASHKVFINGAHEARE